MITTGPKMERLTPSWPLDQHAAAVKFAFHVARTSQLHCEVRQSGDSWVIYRAKVSSVTGGSVES